MNFNILTLNPEKKFVDDEKLVRKSTLLKLGGNY